MSHFRTPSPLDDAKQVLAAGEKFEVPILGQRKAETPTPRGQAGQEAKYQKRHVRMFICLHCGKTGGTMIKTGKGYVHEGCRSV